MGRMVAGAFITSFGGIMQKSKGDAVVHTFVSPSPMIAFKITDGHLTDAAITEHPYIFGRWKKLHFIELLFLLLGDEIRRNQLQLIHTMTRAVLSGVPRVGCNVAIVCLTLFMASIETSS